MSVVKISPVKATVYLGMNENFPIFCTPFICCGGISVEELRTKFTELCEFRENRLNESLLT